MAHLAYGVQVDPVAIYTLELGVRMLYVAEVYHQYIIVDIDVQVVYGQAEVSRHTLHRTDDTAGVGSVFYQYATRAQ